ncbi:MAG: AraC family transcriptional regulator [Dokdonella sp.]
MPPATTRMMRAAGKPRGLLRSSAAAGTLQHARVSPSDAFPALCDLVEHFWFVRWDLRGHPAQMRETLPHPNVHLVFERGLTRVFGVHTARFTRVLEGAGCVFGVKFRAGGFRPFIDRPVSTLTEGSLSLQEVFAADADTLEDDVLCGVDEHAMIETATRFLVAHLPPPDANVARVANIVADIAADRSVLRVDDLVSRRGLNARALQRLFDNYVGVGPKWVINRYRLHEAIELLANGKPVDWTALALELGYFDQAHFIRDFRRLIGRTPGEYARGAGVPPG